MTIKGTTGNEVNPVISMKILCRIGMIKDQNAIVGKKSLFFCMLPAGKYWQTWTWNFGTERTYYTEHNASLNVEAIKM